MLLAEYDYDTDIAVQRQESLILGIQQGIKCGIERGRSVGFADGIEQGINRGAYQKTIETAKNLLGIGLSVEDIVKVTGLSREEIEKL